MGNLEPPNLALPDDLSILADNSRSENLHKHSSVGFVVRYEAYISGQQSWILRLSSSKLLQTFGNGVFVQRLNFANTDHWRSFANDERF